MSKSLKVVAVLPARGGSQRILRKNIRSFAGKPMIHWPIKALQSCALIDDIIISTDDDDVAATGAACGVQAPFKRPENLSDNYATTLAVTRHALDWYEENHGEIGVIITVYPTAVFLEPHHLQEALEQISPGKVETVFPVIEFPYPIQRGLFLEEDCTARMINTEHHSTRSQDLRTAYHDAGQFYVQTPDAVRSNIPLLSNKAFSHNSKPP